MASYYETVYYMLEKGALDMFLHINEDYIVKQSIHHTLQFIANLRKSELYDMSHILGLRFDRRMKKIELQKCIIDVVCSLKQCPNPNMNKAVEPKLLSSY